MPNIPLPGPIETFPDAIDVPTFFAADGVGGWHSISTLAAFSTEVGPNHREVGMAVLTEDTELIYTNTAFGLQPARVAGGIQFAAFNPLLPDGFYLQYDYVTGEGDAYSTTYVVADDPQLPRQGIPMQRIGDQNVFSNKQWRPAYFNFLAYGDVTGGSPDATVVRSLQNVPLPDPTTASNGEALTLSVTPFPPFASMCRTLDSSVSGIFYAITQGASPTLYKFFFSNQTRAPRVISKTVMSGLPAIQALRTCPAYSPDVAIAHSFSVRVLALSADGTEIFIIEDRTLPQLFNYTSQGLDLPNSAAVVGIVSSGGGVFGLPASISEFNLNNGDAIYVGYDNGAGSYELQQYSMRTTMSDYPVPNTTTVDTISTPEFVTACAFGGQDLTAVYAVSSTHLSTYSFGPLTLQQDTILSPGENGLDVEVSQSVSPGFTGPSAFLTTLNVYSAVDWNPPVLDFALPGGFTPGRIYWGPAGAFCVTSGAADGQFLYNGGVLAVADANDTFFGMVWLPLSESWVSPIGILTNPDTTWPLYKDGIWLGVNNSVAPLNGFRHHRWDLGGFDGVTASSELAYVFNTGIDPHNPPTFGDVTPMPVLYVGTVFATEVHRESDGLFTVFPTVTPPVFGIPAGVTTGVGARVFYGISATPQDQLVLVLTDSDPTGATAAYVPLGTGAASLRVIDTSNLPATYPPITVFRDFDGGTWFTVQPGTKTLVYGEGPQNIANVLAPVAQPSGSDIEVVAPTYDLSGNAIFTFVTAAPLKIAVGDGPAPPAVSIVMDFNTGGLDAHGLRVLQYQAPGGWPSATLAGIDTPLYFSGLRQDLAADILPGDGLLLLSGADAGSYPGVSVGAANFVLAIQFGPGRNQLVSDQAVIAQLGSTRIIAGQVQASSLDDSYYGSRGAGGALVGAAWVLPYASIEVGTLTIDVDPALLVGATSIEVPHQTGGVLPGWHAYYINTTALPVTLTFVDFPANPLTVPPGHVGLALIQHTDPAGPGTFPILRDLG
jgi:hypothetical protein